MVNFRNFVAVADRKLCKIIGRGLYDPDLPITFMINWEGKYFEVTYAHNDGQWSMFSYDIAN